MKPKGIRSKFPFIGCLFLVLALLGWLLAPQYYGSFILPLFISALLFIIAGPANLKYFFINIFGGLNIKRAALNVGFMAVVFILGSPFLSLGGLDLSGTEKFTLTPQTQALLNNLKDPINIEVNLGAQHGEESRVRALMNLFTQAAPGKVNVKFIDPQTQPTTQGGGLGLASPNTAVIRTGNFEETISPINEITLYGAVSRSANPKARVVYFLVTFGEKLVNDPSPRGLERLGQNLGMHRIIAQDYLWNEGDHVPAAAAAVVLAGPRAPLGALREKALLTYLKNGGRAIIMADPFTSAFSDEFWAELGLSYGEGLVYDPQYRLSGTNDVFIFTRDFPFHVITEGQTQPVLWPLSGAFWPKAGVTQEHGILALSSAASWLETDGASIQDKSAHYNKDADKPGPLALALASEIKPNVPEDKAGRLVVFGDSDFASNIFIGHQGNERLTLSSILWLLDGDTVTAPFIMPASLNITGETARFTFWLPILVWPALALGGWGIYYYRRRGRA